MYTTSYSTGFPIWIVVAGLVVSIGCAVGSYFLATRSGRSGVGFALLGFFLGILGLIITLIVCKNPAANQYQQPYQQQPYYPPQQPPYPPQQPPYPPQQQYQQPPPNPQYQPPQPPPQQPQMQPPPPPRPPMKQPPEL